MSAPHTTPALNTNIGLLANSVRIDPEASAQTMADDAHNLLNAAVRAIEQMSDAASFEHAPSEIRDNWWAMLYTLRAGMGAFDRLHDLVHTGEAK